MRLLELLLLLAGVAVAATAIPTAGAAERSSVPEKYRWDLRDLYPSMDAWARAKEKIAAKIPDLARFRGRLGESPSRFHEALWAIAEVDMELSRLLAYAMQLADEDRQIDDHLELEQAAEELSVRFRAAISYVTPEILALGDDTVRRFVSEEPKLSDFRQVLDDILRRRPHTLSPEEEKIVALAGNLADAGASLHGIFTNADLPYPTVTLSGGETVRLDAAAYTRHRASSNREDRDKVFRTFWGNYKNYTRTLGTALYSQVKAHVFHKDVHRFDSCLDASLFGSNVPARVYTQLIADARTNLPTLHRYLALRRRMLGLDELRYEDLYASLVKDVDLTYTPEEAMQITLEAFAPLGEEYVSSLREGYDQRWNDFLPSTGKRSGAYSNTVYGVHPYQLLNFNGRYEDLSTLAHESGHSMHSFLSNKHQPFPTHDYSIFVAEVASTLNENLLFHYMLERAGDDATRLFLLGSYLDNLRTTLFRQALFAEFELEIHRMAERGEPLSGDRLSRVYLQLARTYYGHDEGVCSVDDLYAAEWAYIPHFYYNFYVYQYATSMVAAVSLAGGILDEAGAEPPATTRRDAFIRMLSAGSSKYPIDLLRDAGVDMTTSRPFESTMGEMNRIIDEMESILERQKAGK